MAEPSEDLVQETDVSVCRTCLQRCDEVNTLYDIFQAWSSPWAGMGATIAEDLAKIANIEVPASDIYPKFICHMCHEVLLDAARFAEKVRYCDTVLKQRCMDIMENVKTEIDEENNWPKPIQIDKNINSSVFERSSEINIKQEVISDEEYGNESMGYMDSGLDIKVEPEEMEEPPPMQITINGTMSLNPDLNNPVTNGIENHGEQHLEVVVKQEPMSDEEDNAVVPDVPLECMLCAKSFQKITGLKAHVIAEHSYKSVKRKSTGRTSPAKKQNNAYKYICKICKRSFATSTDLLVHETCHNMFTCYGCYNMFDSFEKLTKHRMTKCKASHSVEVQRPKTLDDVLRPKLENVKPSSPRLDTNPVPQADPAVDIKPTLDVNQASDTNPGPKIKLVSPTKLMSENKPLFQIDHSMEEAGVSLMLGTNPESEIRDSVTIKTETCINLLSEINPVSVNHPVFEINPDNTYSVSNNSSLSDINSMETRSVSDTNPVSDSGPMVLDINVTKDIKVMSERTTDKSGEPTSDSSMELHLEIHSSSKKSEPMDESDEVELTNSDMQVESVCDDDKQQCTVKADILP